MNVLDHMARLIEEGTTDCLFEALRIASPNEAKRGGPNYDALRYAAGGPLMLLKLDDSLPKEDMLKIIRLAKENLAPEQTYQSAFEALAKVRIDIESIREKHATAHMMYLGGLGALQLALSQISLAATLVDQDNRKREENEALG